MEDQNLDTSANDNTGAPGEELTNAPGTLAGGDPSETPKPEGDQKPEGEQKPTEEKPQGAPEEYADFTFADGIEVDKDLLDKVKAEFKTAGLSQEQAQKALDLHVANMQAQREAFIQTRKEWVEELRADKEYGGEKFDETVRGAQLALRQFDPKGEMVELLNVSGFGDNPHVVKFLARISKALGEDSVHTERSRDNGKEPPLHERLYGKDGMGPEPKP